MTAQRHHQLELSTSYPTRHTSSQEAPPCFAHQAKHYHALVHCLDQAKYKLHMKTQFANVLPVSIECRYIDGQKPCFSRRL